MGLLALGHLIDNSGGDLRRCYTQPHQLYGGLDLHARSLDRCILNQDGELLEPRHLKAAPEPLLKAIAPYREDRVGGVEGLVTGSWLADLCARAGRAFVLGQALDRQASHGGQATNATIDAPQSAGWLRGGMLPQADVEPAERRATRDVLRRRRPLRRPRAARLAPMHHPTRPSNRPAIGTTRAANAHRQGVAERLPEPAVHQRRAVDRARLDHDDSRRRAVALCSRNTATPHDRHTL
jgi:hypothetical protein